MFVGEYQPNKGSQLKCPRKFRRSMYTIVRSDEQEEPMDDWGGRNGKIFGVIVAVAVFVLLSVTIIGMLL